MDMFIYNLQNFIVIVLITNYLIYIPIITLSMILGVYKEFGISKRDFLLDVAIPYRRFVLMVIKQYKSLS